MVAPKKLGIVSDQDVQYNRCDLLPYVCNELIRVLEETPEEVLRLVEQNGMVASDRLPVEGFVEDAPVSPPLRTVVEERELP